MDWPDEGDDDRWEPETPEPVMAENPLEIWMPRDWMIELLERSLAAISTNAPKMDLTDEDAERVKRLVERREALFAGRPAQPSPGAR